MWVMSELYVGLKEYFIFYNGERFHQSLKYKTPDEVYLSETGGGAKIVDHFGEKKNSSTEEITQR